MRSLAQKPAAPLGALNGRKLAPVAAGDPTAADGTHQEPDGPTNGAHARPHAAKKRGLTRAWFLPGGVVIRWGKYLIAGIVTSAETPRALLICPGHRRNPPVLVLPILTPPREEGASFPYRA